MNYDEAKADEMTLALMFLTAFGEEDIARTWKGYSWDVMDRLHAAGYIGNPAKKTKSVPLTDEGARRCRELFEKHFGCVEGKK